MRREPSCHEEFEGHTRLESAHTSLNYFFFLYLSPHSPPQSTISSFLFPLPLRCVPHPTLYLSLSLSFVSPRTVSLPLGIYTTFPSFPLPLEQSTHSDCTRLIRGTAASGTLSLSLSRARVSGERTNRRTHRRSRYNLLNTSGKSPGC